MVHVVAIDVHPYSIVVWALIGLIAGALAGRVVLGRGLGCLADIVVGIVGALIGGWLVRYFHLRLVVVGHPIVSEIIVAFIGALVLLLVLHLLGFGRTRRAL
jgi:uncharacterized membrane protein YeaQ/YmgE (transglycosylase-associated protein family)